MCAIPPQFDSPSFLGRRVTGARKALASACAVFSDRISHTIVAKHLRPIPVTAPSSIGDCSPRHSVNPTPPSF